MIHLDRTHFALLIATAILVAGCSRGAAPETDSVALPVAPAVATSPAPAQPAPAGADSKTAPTPDLAASSPSKSPAAEFTPPFPDRLELFEPPKRAQGVVKRDDENGASVELKGFINVDQPRVILSIDGVVSPVPEGGEKYGVRVITIQPPTAVLQRGRNRWTAKLE